MSTLGDKSIESRVTEYAREFVKGYHQAIDVHFRDAKDLITRAGLDRDHFPLYGRRLGTDLAIAIFYTQIDFYLFFLDKLETEIETIEHEVAYNTREFGLQWVSDTPKRQRTQRVKEYLGLQDSRILWPAPSSETININEVNFSAWDALNMRVQGHQDGANAGHQAGEHAESALPQIRENLRQTDRKSEFSKRYRQLLESGMRAQDRGNEFEELWRKVLEFYGWNPKKFRISGEENDFTAIYQGLHILGEVKWFDTPMDGAKMREFLAKLDPRPQTIGLFITYSGVNEGGRDAIRRTVHTKTVVIFSKEEIEKVMFGSDPGPIFAKKLREVYDYILEPSKKS